jgi:tetratricopeptide (TPR) repeat protein/glycosyltransferase involved in cell wall biosynthesis
MTDNNLRNGPSSPVLNVLVIHDGLPHFDRGGSDVRLMQVLDALQRQRCHTTFIGRSAAERERYAPQLERMGIRTFAGDAEKTRFCGLDFDPQWRLADVLAEGRFDLAILCLWFWGRISIPEQYINDIRRLSPATFIAVLSDDRHGLREKRMAELTDSWADVERANDYQQRELEILREADLVLAISEEDRAGLLELAPELAIAILPMVARAAPEGPGFGPRKDLLFIANFDNLANRDGLDWLLAEVWPRVRQSLPQVELSLVGNNVPGNARFTEGVTVAGFAPELIPHLHRHRLFLSPIRFGTGIKTKNILALEHGLPLVTTTVGAEGMKLQHGRQALIADSAADFAACVVEAYQDEKLWNDLRVHGRSHVLQEFSSERLEEQVKRTIEIASCPRINAPRAEHCFSICAVEKRFPEVLEHQPAGERPYVRMIKYAEYAHELLERGMVQAALEQLRHSLAFFPTSVPGGNFFLTAFQQMARCYRRLGDSRAAKRCQQESRRCRKQENTAGRANQKRQSGFNRSHLRPTIALAMITRNAIEHLPVCLTSVREWVDELVVADTGSTDATPDVARCFGAKVISIPWDNDFAAARNRALEAVNSDWVLVLDSDEELDPSAGASLRNLLSRSDVGGFRIPIRHYVRNLHLRGWDQMPKRNDSTLPRARQFAGYVEQKTVRMFRRNPKIFFEGRVHEMVDRSILRLGLKIADAPLCIHHYGHVAPAAQLAEKNLLYRDLAQLKVRDMPQDAQARMELGLLELESFHDTAAALACFDCACELEPTNSAAWLFAGIAAVQLGRPQEALSRLRQVPRHGRSARLLAENEGEAYFQLRQFEAAAECFRRARQCVPDDPGLESKLGLCEVRAGNVTPGITKLRDALAEDHSSAELHDRLITVLIWLNRLAEAAEAAEAKIQQLPPAPEFFLRAASIRAQLQEWDRVEELLHSGLAKFPEADALKQALSEIPSPADC